MSSNAPKSRFSGPLRMVLMGAVSLTCVAGGFLITHLLNGPDSRTSEGIPANGEQNPQIVDSADLEVTDVAADSSADSLTTRGDIGSADALSATPPSGTTETDRAAAAGSSTTTLRRTDEFAAQLTIADEHLESGNITRAYDIYSDLRNLTTGPVPPALHFRLALAAEAFGDYATAIQLYRDLQANAQDQPWTAVASLGWARCLDALGRQDLLTRQFLAAAVLDDWQMPREARLELTHLLGRAFVSGLPRLSQPDLLQDDAVVLPRFRMNTIDALGSIERYAGVQSPPPQKQECTVLQSLGTTPGSVFLRVHLADADIERLIAVVCTAAGFQLQITEGAHLALAEHTADIRTDDRSLALLLDGLTMPHGVTWHQVDQQIVIESLEDRGWETANARLMESAERIQRHALMEAPASVQAGYTRAALGVLQFTSGRMSDAAHTFSVQLESEPRSGIRAETAFNLGKCRLQLRQPQEARDSFVLGLDSANNVHDVRIACHLYVGRLQIERGETQPALTTLRRGLSLAIGTEYEARAALTLSSAYLMVESPHGANAVLMERREILQQQPYRAATAFLSSLARFRAAVLPDRREREARTLVIALSQFQPSLQFGNHWYVLTAECCEDLGLSELARQNWHNALERLQDVPLRHHVVMRLADSYRQNHDYQTADQLLTLLPTETADRTADTILLRTAELAHLQGNDDQVIRTCRQVLVRSEDDDIRRRALRMLGMAYERMKKHQAAVYCFAGMLPEALAAGGDLPTILPPEDAP